MIILYCKFYLIIFLGISVFSYFSLNFVYGDDIFVPDWLFVVYNFFLDDKISYLEFGNVIQYLQKQDILFLEMDKGYDPVTNFLITLSQQKEDMLIQFSNCTSDWYITGYFTPVESDYSGNFVSVSIDDEIQYFRFDFLSEVKTEGWGKTRLGNYIGWYGDKFHFSMVPLDSHGNNLLVQSVAVDSEIISQKTNLIIPKLPPPWNKMIFESADIGPSIIGKHIDVYTGEGKMAELETFRITNYDNDVCVES